MIKMETKTALGLAKLTITLLVLTIGAFIGIFVRLSIIETKQDTMIAFQEKSYNTWQASTDKLDVEVDKLDAEVDKLNSDVAVLKVYHQ